MSSRIVTFLEAALVVTAWWTRTQRIRTVSQIPIEPLLLEVSPPPLYQQIASRAQHPRELGMSYRQIGQALGVTPKTAAKAAAWRGATR